MQLKVGRNRSAAFTVTCQSQTARENHNYAGGLYARPCRTVFPERAFALFSMVVKTII
jgi:hypothetical protein